MIRTTLGALAVFLLLSPSAVWSAGPADADNNLSFLDGFTLVALDTDDIPSLHQARELIESHGGHIAIMSPPSILMGRKGRRT